VVLKWCCFRWAVTRAADVKSGVSLLSSASAVYSASYSYPVAFDDENGVYRDRQLEVVLNRASEPLDTKSPSDSQSFKRIFFVPSGSSYCST
jgi:hypothetical protein